MPVSRTNADGMHGRSRSAVSLVAAPAGPVDAPEVGATPILSEGWAGLLRQFGWLRMLALGAGLVVALGFIRPAAYEFPTLRSGVETAMTLVALVGAWWMGRQFLHTHRLRTLFLVAALVTLAETEFPANALPAMLNVHSASGLGAPLLLGQLIAAGMLLAAARTGSDRLTPSSHRALAMAAGVATLATGLAAAAGLAMRGLLITSPHRTAVLHQALHHPFGLVVLLGTVGLFGYAAACFARQGRLEDDPVLSLLAGAALLLAAGRFYYLTLPSVSPGAVTFREVLRFGAFVLVLAAAVRKDLELRMTVARGAAMAERSRVAQDLHDGLAQDLAFIAAHAARLHSELGEDHPLVIAATRALSLSRETIGDLSDTSSASPDEALQAVAAQLGARFEIGVAVDVGRETSLSREDQDNVSRIVREAIANAARHGQAKTVVVTLKQTGAGTVLRVSDDGRGIAEQPGRKRADSFGLAHMRDRAALLGGRLVIRPRRAGGTDVEVLFP